MNISRFFKLSSGNYVNLETVKHFDVTGLKLFIFENRWITVTEEEMTRIVEYITNN